MGGGWGRGDESLPICRREEGSLWWLELATKSFQAAKPHITSRPTITHLPRHHTCRVYLTSFVSKNIPARL